MTCRKKSVQRRTKAEPMQRDEQGIHCRRCQFLSRVDKEGETHQKRSHHLAHVCESKAHPIAGNASSVEGCRSSTLFSEMGAKRVSLSRLPCAQGDWHREEHGIACRRGQALLEEDKEIATHENQGNHHSHACESKSHAIASNASCLEGCRSSTFTSDISTTKIVVSTAKREKTGTRRLAKMPGACAFNMVMVQRHRTSGRRQRQVPAVVRLVCGSTCSAVLRSHLLMDIRYRSVQESYTSKIALLQLLRSVVSPRGNLVPEETVRKNRDVAEAKHPMELARSTFCVSSAAHMRPSTETTFWGLRAQTQSVI